mmetsp:Transcript_12699/g.22462  ORF Transcript_12699/g.22462 Transcript_12699/m.22462 type:complete len:83 (+) Transcript_12699:77-325(+)
MLSIARLVAMSPADQWQPISSPAQRKITVELPFLTRLLARLSRVAAVVVKQQQCRQQAKAAGAQNAGDLIKASCHLYYLFLN